MSDGNTFKIEELNVEDGAVVATFEIPADHPLAKALRPGAPHYTREEWAAVRRAENNGTRDRIKQVILRFNWGNYGLDDLERFKHDAGAQDWAEHLADAVLVHINGDLGYTRDELGQVAWLATRAQAAGEQIDPGSVLDIVGWPVTGEKP